jgi:hypothetical protein
MTWSGKLKSRSEVFMTKEKQRQPQQQNKAYPKIHKQDPAVAPGRFYTGVVANKKKERCWRRRKRC